MRKAGIFALVLLAAPAAASETVTYTYDALGRLVKVEHAGGRNENVVVDLAYDPANNRQSYVVTGQSGKRVIVVPLNGFTVIPLPD